MSAIAEAKARALTPEQLMELVDYTELPDGRWKAIMEGGQAGRLKIVGKTLPRVTRAMESMAKIIGESLEKRRVDAGQPESLVAQLFGEKPESELASLGLKRKA